MFVKYQMISSDGRGGFSFQAKRKSVYPGNIEILKKIMILQHKAFLSLQNIKLYDRDYDIEQWNYFPFIHF